MSRRATHPRSVANTVIGSVAVLTAVAALAACGDDDKPAAAATTKPGPAASTGSRASAPDPFCSTWVTVDQVGMKIGDPDLPVDARKSAGASVLDALATAKTPPAGLADAIAAVAAAITPVKESGNTDATGTHEFQRALDTLGGWVFDHCGYRQVEATYADYKYAGLPAALPAGITSFKVTNSGADMHMMVWARIHDDVTMPVDQLLHADDTTVQSDVDVIGGSSPIPSGASAYLSIDLQPGRYAVFCPLPMGWHGDGPPPSAAPHFMSGMFTEVHVG